MNSKSGSRSTSETAAHFLSPPPGSVGFDNGWQLRAENGIPETAGHAETKLVVEEMVLEVILLQLLIPHWQVPVMQEIVGKVVADVTEDAAAVHGRGGIPVVEEDGMGQLPERGREDHEEGRRHDETVPVHRKVVVDAVEEKVGGYAHTVIREPSEEKKKDKVSKTTKRKHRMFTGQTHTHRDGTGIGALGIRPRSI